MILPALNIGPNDAVPNFISLGAGVQSSAMALMAAKGEIAPMPSAAVFADTQDEPREVYEWLEWLRPNLPFPIVTVSAGSLSETSLQVRVSRKSGNSYTNNLIPAYVKNVDGSKGLLGRRCTSTFKIAPIQRWARGDYAVNVRKPSVQVIQWVGISDEEWFRAKASRKRWMQTRWPLIERRLSRNDCIEWMKGNGYPVPPRSACVYCPFHGDSEWLHLRNNQPEAFASAVKFERDLQETTSTQTVYKGVPFLHASLVPLSEVEFGNEPDHSQLTLFANDCEGMCGV